MIQFEVSGVVPSKANSYKIGRGNFYRDSSVSNYEELFRWQTLCVPKNTFNKKSNLYVRYEFYVKNMGQDSDNIEKTVNDIMQKSEIIFNDKKIIYHTTMKTSDKINPRIKITIEELK